MEGEEMKYCHNCGEAMDDEIIFCRNCGESQINDGEMNSKENSSEAKESHRSRWSLSRMPLSLGVFSAAITGLGYIFAMYIDENIGGLIFGVSGATVIICLVWLLYVLIFGSINLGVSIALLSAYVGMIGYFLNMHSVMLGGACVCFVLIALRLFKLIFYHK